MSVFMQMSELKFTIKQDAALTQVFNLVKILHDHCDIKIYLYYQVN